MPLLTSKEKEAIIRRRGCRSAKTGEKHRVSNLIIHHRNRNPENNDPKNLAVLTIKEHEALHKRMRK